MTRRFDWVPLSADVLPLVVEVEKTAYSHPWTVGHFSDTMNAGHHTQVLLGEALPGDVGLPTLADPMEAAARAFEQDPETTKLRALVEATPIPLVVTAIPGHEVLHLNPPAEAWLAAHAELAPPVRAGA